MSVLSVASCALLSAVCAFTLVSASGCGPDAKGVEACREIEQARCTAAKNCGIVDDVEECQRFYRDQCLHGMAVATPSSVVVRECVAVIRSAGVCAAEAEGSETPLDSCSAGTPTLDDAPGAETACDIVKAPEKALACAFLAPDQDAGTGGGDSGGGGGAAGSSEDDEPAGSGGT